MAPCPLLLLSHGSGQWLELVHTWIDRWTDGVEERSREGGREADRLGKRWEIKEPGTAGEGVAPWRPSRGNSHILLSYSPASMTNGCHVGSEWQGIGSLWPLLHSLISRACLSLLHQCSHPSVVSDRHIQGDGRCGNGFNPTKPPGGSCQPWQPPGPSSPGRFCLWPPYPWGSGVSSVSILQ